MIKSAAEIVRPEELFGEYGVSEEDQARYLDLIRDGKEDQANEEFFEAYILPYTIAYTEQMAAYMRAAAEGEIPARERDRMAASVTATTLLLGVILAQNFEQFARPYASIKFEQNGVRNAGVRKAIIDKTLEKFREKTNGALSQTNTSVLDSIRSVQSDFVIANRRIARLRGGDIDAQVQAFKDEIRRRHPKLYADIEAGKVIRVNRGGKVVSYRLDKYADMAVRTTVLEIDRTAVEFVEQIKGSEVVEYQLVDPRAVKDEREICIHILSSRIAGKSLLALTPEAAQKYGILTVAQAREQGAMGPYCRHGIRPVSKTFSNKISKQAVA